MYEGVKSEDALKHFFADVHALYLKVCVACALLELGLLSCADVGCGVLVWEAVAVAVAGFVRHAALSALPVVGSCSRVSNLPDSCC